jgi:hypothetical protein
VPKGFEYCGCVRPEIYEAVGTDNITDVANEQSFFLKIE